MTEAEYRVAQIKVTLDQEKRRREEDNPCRHCGLPLNRHALAHDNCKFVPTSDGGYQTTYEPAR